MARPRMIWLLPVVLGGGCEELLEDIGPSTDGPAVVGAEDGTEATPTPVVDRIGSLEEHAAAVGLRPRADGTYLRETESGRPVAVVAADGSVTFVPKKAESPRPGVALPGVGEDRQPSALDRTRFMEETVEFRGRLAATTLREQMNVRLAALPGELRAIWRTDSRPAADRRRILFERWEETFTQDATEELPVDPSARALARVRAEGAAAVRSEIERFVRQTLPTGSPDAYTAAELDGLNATRATGRRFAPYAELER